MNYSKYDSKNDPKANANHASVTLPSTPDANKDKSPTQAEQKGNDGKPNAQPQSAPDVGNRAKGDGHDHRNQPGWTDGKATVKAASSGDKADSEAMINEGGHASPGKTPDAIREPDASIVAKNEPSKGSADGAADKPDLSAKPAN